MTTTTTVTDAQVEAVTQYMQGSIGNDDWPGAGNPSDWDEDSRDGWFLAGNRAVLEQQNDITAGNITAGRVWCEAADTHEGFDYTTATEDYLHGWFRDHQARLLDAVRTAQESILATVPITVPITHGMTALYEGRLVKVTQVDGDQAVVHGRSDQGTIRPTVPLSALTPVRFGVDRFRVREGRKASYGPQVREIGDRVVTLDEWYGSFQSGDRAVYVRPVDSPGERIYVCGSYLEPVAAEVVEPERPRLPGVEQTVWLDDNSCGLVLSSEEVREQRQDIAVYTYLRSSWSNRHVPLARLRFALEGDRVRHQDGREGTFIRNITNMSAGVRWDGEHGDASRVDRHRVTFIGSAPPLVPITDLVVTVDGVEYVRKDVIDKDIETFVGITHQKSVDHSLCGVYDETQRTVDASTTYLKMGERYGTYDVTVTETLTVSRVVRVQRTTNEAEAIRQAQAIVSDYPTGATSSRRTDAVSVLRRERTGTVASRVRT